jgi:hypothetical protein
MPWLPSWPASGSKLQEPRRLYRQALDAHARALTAKQFNAIRACLHPDNLARMGVTDPAAVKRFTDASALLNACAPLVVRKKDRDTVMPAEPKQRPFTAEDWAAVKRYAQAQRAAKRAASKKPPPSKPPPRTQTSKP